MSRCGKKDGTGTEYNSEMFVNRLSLLRCFCSDIVFAVAQNFDAV